MLVYIRHSSYLYNGVLLFHPYTIQNKNPPSTTLKLQNNSHKVKPLV